VEVSSQSCNSSTKKIKIKIKIQPKIIDCIFIRYVNNNVTYHFLMHKSYILDIYINKIIEFKDALVFRK
jgi:hypothetical protein